jgi:SAM-dependent methyltransferase
VLSSASKLGEEEDVATVDPQRWSQDPYPDYVAEVNRSIAFSGAEQDFFTIGKARRILDLLKRLGETPAEMDLLDIGCGVGLIHRHLASNFRTIVGMDVAGDALDAARAANPSVHYDHHDGRRLPCADRSFDAAIAICVMHHVPPAQWQDFVAEARRALRPGGVLMIFEHNPWNPLTRWAVARCAFDFDAVLLSAPRTTGLLQQGGFEQIEREFMFFTPFSAAPAQWAEQRLGWCPAGAQYVAYGRRERG